MSGFYNKYGTDANLIEDGVWVDDFGDFSVKFRNPQSTKAREALRRLQEHPKNKPTLQRASRLREDPPVEFQETLNKEWMATGIIVDWKVSDRQGNPIAFSPRAALEFFDEFPFFLADCWTAATERSIFLPVDQELAREDLGN